MIKKKAATKCQGTYPKPDSTRREKKNGLTEIEKRYATGIWGEPGAHPGFDWNDQKHWPDLRQSMKRIAYNEAGYFAVMVFTRYQHYNVTSISIIPDQEFHGCVNVERGAIAEFSLEHHPPLLQRFHGRMLLLRLLAGLGVEMMLDQSEEWESIFEYWDSEYNFGNDLDDVEEGTDIFRVLRIAKIMAKPYMPYYRIINLTDKWTLEMLKIPAVWNIVETMAGKLIEHGEIMDEELRDIAYDKDFRSMFHFPKWKRRLLYKPEECKEFDEDD